MFEELLAHPAVQAAAAPFAAALVVAIALRRSRFVGLAIAAAFVTVVALTIGFSLEPLTGSRKMVLAALAATLVAVLLEVAVPRATRAQRAVLAAAVGAAGVWVVLRVLLRQDGGAALAAGLAAAAYMALLVDGAHGLRHDALRGAALALGLGIAAAVLGFLGASAWLAQVGTALAAGAAAVLLVLVVGRSRPAAGWTLVLPASVVAGLVGLLAVFTGNLSWYAVLPPLALPWLLSLQPRRP